MKHIFTIIILALCCFKLNAQTENSDAYPINNPTLQMPTIYVVGEITPLDRELSNAFKRKHIRVNNDNRYPITQVDQAFIDNMIAEIKAQNLSSVQNFIIAHTLLEAYEIDAGVREVVYYEMK